VRRLKLLVAGLSPRRPAFAPGLINVGFVAGEAAPGQGFLRFLRFASSICHSTIAAYSSVTAPTGVRYPWPSSLPPIPILSQLNPLQTPLANLPKIRSDPILPSTPLVFRVVSFLPAFPPNPWKLFSPLPCLLRAPPTSFPLIWSA
jgi:hypothetical protein